MEEVQSELKEIRRMMEDVSYQMQKLRESIGGTSVSAPLLPMPQPYVHPWWQHQRPGSEPGGNHYWEQDKTTTDNIDETRSRVSGTEEAA